VDISSVIIGGVQILITVGGGIMGLQFKNIKERIEQVANRSEQIAEELREKAIEVETRLNKNFEKSEGQDSLELRRLNDSTITGFAQLSKEVHETQLDLKELETRFMIWNEIIMRQSIKPPFG